MKPDAHPPASAAQEMTAIQRALALFHANRLDESDDAFREVPAGSRHRLTALQMRGVIAARQLRHAEAADLFRQAIEIDADAAGLHNNLANALSSQGLHEQALREFDIALRLEPTHLDALTNRAATLLSLQRNEDALAAYEAALATRPDHVGAMLGRGKALRALQQDEAALACFDAVLSRQPDHAWAHGYRAMALKSLGRADEALPSYEAARRLEPRNQVFIYNHGNGLLALKRHEEAIRAYDEALAIRPDLARAWFNRGNALEALGRHEAALESCRKALELEPDYAEALNGCATALLGLNRPQEALTACERALDISQDFVQVRYSQADALKRLKRFAEAARVYEQALEREPEGRFTLGAIIECLQRICDWSGLAERQQAVLEGVEAGRAVCSPFVFLAISDDPAAQLRCATTSAVDRVEAGLEALAPSTPYAHGRIRVGYLSADFHNHATALLMAELFEIHDRTRFEWYAYSFGPERTGPMRQRIERAFDHFHEVGHLTDRDIAQRVRDDEIDIAVDLKGLTLHSRPGIFAYRPAPIQVAYIGYPGTSGLPFIDYVIGDHVVTPPGHEDWYSEKLVRLPHSYQVNDRHRKVASRTPSRTAMGLPEVGFVFCCFNNNYKITPQMFDVWMRLLQRVDGSVLWLLADTDEVKPHLWRQAQTRGVSPDRLVFAPRVAVAEHLARHRLADLFLDTIPVNAHTTASDALWVGLPVLTCMGRGFASRVAASLLHAMNLPELVTTDLEAYEARAIHLATHPAELAGLRERLIAGRETAPLFDTDRFRRHLEAAYELMQARHQQGLAPAMIEIDPIEPPDRPTMPAPANARAVTELPAQDDGADELFARGTVCLRARRFAEARRLLDEAAALRPDHPATHCNRAAACLELGDFAAAREASQRAVDIDPAFGDGWANLGAALLRLERKQDAVQAFERACALRPRNASFHANLALALAAVDRPGAAARARAVARSIAPTSQPLKSADVFAMRQACIWPEPDDPGDPVDRLERDLTRMALEGERPCSPFVLLSIDDDPGHLLTCARHYHRLRFPASPNPLWRGERYAHDRIRIAYVSADFHGHATAYLMSELFEVHDRQQFEWWGISFGPDDRSPTRQRLMRAFDHFVDVRDQSDLEVAQLLRTLEIDIAVDLKGYTRDCRTGIFAHRFAPVQVGYLGYPGTLGAPYFDAIIGDAVVTPPEHDRFYTERVLRLPDCYQVNDRHRTIASHTPSRRELGLPESGFVFCCFNNNYKLSPGMFSIWMRLLQAVPGSVLWLLESNAESAQNLRQQAEKRGVDADRLVFAPLLPLPHHLARQRRADLFLDTIPVNAHTTASDALWVGLPVLTCLGSAFPGRVAASLLTAIGMPELITRSLAEYEARALHLAQHPDELAALRDKLARHRDTMPLFDTERFRLHVEALFRTLHDQARQSLPPAGLEGSAPVDIERVQRLFKEGTALLRTRRFSAALERLDEAARLQPEDPYTHSNRAVALLELKRFEAAREACERATKLAPDFADAWNNLGSTLMKLGKTAEALPAFDRACALRADQADFHSNRGAALMALRQHGRAAQAYARVRELDTSYRGLHSSEIFARRCACIWPDEDPSWATSLEDYLTNPAPAQPPFAPFVVLALRDDPVLHQRAARLYTQHRYPPAKSPLWQGQPYRHERVRVAYLSADFHSHATAYLMAELFELHNRTHFEWWGVSFGAADQSPMRARLERAFDHFLDVRDKSDLEIASELRALEIDIAVDLKGYTRDCRPGILAHRPAPIQVNYLGFPGTMGSPCIDYLIGDPVVTPPEHDRYYDEKVIRLPNCYQVNDRQRPVADHTPSRSVLGLPETAFVFCCFNNNYKITPALFDIWMRLLHAVPGSVLWLLESNTESASNLLAEAARRGVESARIVFAPKLPLPDHLARHRCADLFLDTLPYNAHTTTSDALWAGLPVLTCLGKAFPGRVAASLLTAIQVPELITDSLADYETRALHLATHPEELAAIRDKIQRNRLTTALFDTDRFRRDLETAYLTMLALPDRPSDLVPAQ